MKTHITTLNNMAGTSALAHRRVLKVAQALGCHEMGTSYYHLQPDYAKEIHKRLDGIIAPLNYGDIVIFQYPSWIGVNYDESFVDKIKSYRDTKLIIFVQDIQKLMFDSEQMILDMEIRTLNKADLLILPSKKMHQYLMENGLKDKSVIYQTIWDMPSDICFEDHAIKRCFHFTGSFSRFPFLANYRGKTLIYQYDRNEPERKNDESFLWRGYYEQEKLMYELSKGGFGLVWSDDEYFKRYYSMNQPYKLGTNLAAGIPVIVRKGCVHEEFVIKNGVGFAVDTLEEADEIVQNISEDEYRQLYRNVKNIQKLILDGAYTRKTLQDAIITVLENSCSEVENKYDTKLNITVKNNADTLDIILKNKCSIARFGDGEFDIIAGNSIPYQEYNEKLASEMKAIISRQSDEKFMTCLPDVFENQDRYNEACRNFWKGHLQVYRQVYKVICTADWYGSTFVSRPYIDLADKSSVTGYFEKLKTLWDHKDVLIVEGLTTRSGVGNDLFDNAKSVIRIICPSRNSYASIDKIENKIMKYGRDKLILLMLGPTAKVIAYHLYSKGYWLIDIGHIDSEYEWYKRGALEKIKLPNKHTAEHNYDQDIVFEHDPLYESQIVATING
ncbi:sugar transferase [Agathobacter sp.]